MRLPTLLALAVVVALALPADARVRITCEDGGGAVGRGNGRRFETTWMCDVDHTCDGVCTFAIPGDCVAAELRLGFYTPTGYEVVCDPDVRDAPCPSIVPIIALPVPEAGVERHRRTFGYKNDRFFDVDLVCNANRSCTPPPDPDPATDLTGHWIILETTVTNDCPPDLPYLQYAQFLPPHSVQLEQRGDALRACAAGSTFVGPGSVNADGFDIGPAYLFEAARRRLSGTLAGLPDKVTVTDVVTLYGASSEPACTRTMTGIMARTDPACSGRGRCLGHGPCSRCVRGRCVPIAGCRYRDRPVQ